MNDHSPTRATSGGGRRHPELAIHGGPPVRPDPVPPWPFVTRPERRAVEAVFDSGKINYRTGGEGRAFEAEFAALCDRDHALAVANGTVALELALYALGIGPGDDVVTTPRTFIASASAAALRGARPVFADVDPVSGNLTPATVAAALTPRTRAVVAVHLAGWPCDLAGLRALCDEREIALVEDGAQAHGAATGGRPVGSVGDAAAFSFCQDKILTTGGEGGMVVFADTTAWSRARAYMDHGKSPAAERTQQGRRGFRWVHESFGTNWRLTEMQSALGRVLLARLPADLAARRRHAAQLHAGLADVAGISTAVPPPGVDHAYYKYYAYVDRDALAAGWEVEDIREAIAAEGIPCMQGSCSEVYLERAFDPIRAGDPQYPGDGPDRPRLPIARRLGETALMLQLHPVLDDQGRADAAEGERWMDQTIAAVAKVMAAATA